MGQHVKGLESSSDRLPQHGTDLRVREGCHVLAKQKPARPTADDARCDQPIARTSERASFSGSTTSAMRQNARDHAAALAETANDSKGEQRFGWWMAPCRSPAPLRQNSRVIWHSWHRLALAGTPTQQSPNPKVQGSTPCASTVTLLSIGRTEPRSIAGLAVYR